MPFKDIILLYLMNGKELDMKKAIIGIVMAVMAFACLATSVLGTTVCDPNSGNDKDPVMGLPEGNLPLA